MAATAKWLDPDTVKISVGTSVVARKVRDGDLADFPELRSGRPGRDSNDAPKPEKRRRKAKAKVDA